MVIARTGRDSDDSPPDSLPVGLWRAVRLLCPRCGIGRIMAGWLSAKPACPNCSQPIERGEQDFFLGPMLFNLIVSEIAFSLMMIGWVLVTWPTPPWNLVTMGGVLLMIAAPFAFYPFSKTVWLALDLTFRPNLPESTDQVITPPHPTA